MKIPQKPPNYESLLQKFIHNNKIETILQLTVHLKRETRYLHWDEVRRRPPEKGYTLEEQWIALKLTRTTAYRYIPLLDKQNRPFQYFITDTAQKFLHKIDLGAGGMVGMPDPITNPQTKNRYIISSLMEEAITSSQLEGAVTTRRVAKNMIREGRHPRDRSEQMILNNYRTMQYITTLKDREMTPELLYEIHRHITEGTLKDPDAAGRLRKSGEKIVVSNKENVILHNPPNAEELPNRVNKFCTFANNMNSAEFIPPAIKAIILHFWIAYDHPFVDGNGRTARAIFYWAMLRYGYWLFEFISISGIILKAPAKYLRSFLYTETDDNDLNYFITAQLTVIQRAIKALHEYILRKRQENAKLAAHLKETLRFNHRQQALISHGLRHPGQNYTVKSQQQSHRVAYATARDDILGLVRCGLMKRNKEGKRFVFGFLPDLERRLTAMPGQRS